MQVGGIIGQFAEASGIGTDYSSETFLKALADYQTVIPLVEAAIDQVIATEGDDDKQSEAIAQLSLVAGKAYGLLCTLYAILGISPTIVLPAYLQAYAKDGRYDHSSIASATQSARKIAHE